MSAEDKKSRKARKSALTREINTLRRLMADGERDELDKRLPGLKGKFTEFATAHEKFHSGLKEEDEMDESEAYFEEVENNYIESKLILNKWLAATSEVPKEKIEKTEKTETNDKVDFLTLANLPKVEVEHFDGNPMKYHTFLSVFDEHVHKTSLEPSVKLTRLIQYTTGKAKEAIESCVLLGGKGYEEARAILKQRFGDDFIISNHVIKNIRFGKPVKTPEELQRFCDELTRCKAVLTSMRRLQEIDTQSSVVDIVKRLQPYLRNRWKRQAMEYKRERKAYPGISELVKFVMTETEEALDPVYGSLNQTDLHKPLVSKIKTPTSTSLSVSAASGSSPTPSCLSTQFTPRPAPSCIACRGPRHRLFTCEQFKKMRPSDRFELVQRHKLCENCLMDNHATSQCRKPSVCSVPGCGMKHTKFIHINQPPASTTSVNSREVSVNHVGTVKDDTSQYIDVMLPVVKVVVNGSQETYAMLDTGSNSSFCTERLVKALQIQGNVVKYKLNTLSASQEDKQTMIVDLDLMSCNGDSAMQLSHVFVVPEIPANVPMINFHAYPHLRELPLYTGGCVDILIGQSHAEALIPLETKTGDKGDPFAVKTLFGWSINGPVTSFGKPSTKVVANFISATPADTDIERLWEIEGEDLYSDKQSWSEEDKHVIELWDKQHKMVDGHYQVPVPWRPGVQFPCNYGVAVSRLGSLCGNLKKRGLTQRYQEEVDKLLQQGYAEPVKNQNVLSQKIWYLPHQAVLNVKKPEKLRLVFDCASKFRGESLNDKAYQGPDINNRLIDVLLRFRQHAYAVMADVEAMYNQVVIPTEDRDALRFLWNDDSGNIVEYRMTRHLFGGVWCACSATYCLRRVVYDNPDVADIIKDTICKSFYVDDCLASVCNEDTAVEVINGTRAILAAGGFNLTKFVANKDTVLEQIPEELRAKEVKDLSEGRQSKVLGVRWDVGQDLFVYQRHACGDTTENLTRRSILSFVSGMYDPLGFINPVTVVGRMLFQDACKSQLGWDDVVPQELQQRWKVWTASLQDLDLFRIPRCFKPSPFDDSYMELHHFSDSSSRAYGSCSYIRCVNKNGQIHTSLIMSKCRVAPLKQVTIPRLELQAAVLSAKADQLLRRELELDIVESYFWTDSQVVLSYIRNTTQRFQVFVGNRVSLITGLTNPQQWLHIKGDLNPADLLTRGQQPKTMDMEVWLRGPNFLQRYKPDWPSQDIDTEIKKDDPEVKREVRTACVTSTEVHPIDVLAEYCSSWFKLKRFVAWWIRLQKVLLSKDRSSRKGELSVTEVREAESVIMRHVQSRYYAEDLRLCSSGSTLRRTSQLKSLQPMLDQDGILRIGGRIKHAGLDVNLAHPVIVPHKHRIANLIVKQAHDVAHVGNEWTLSILREKYWITKARSMVKKVRRECFTCKKLFQSPSHQMMADLPEERLTSAKPPFTFIGMDCFGPFAVKFGRAEVKRWGCLYTCLTTRAIHIEKVDSMETDSFLNGYRRFQSRRGTPSKIYCDNGTNFVGAHTELTRALKQLDVGKLTAHGVREETEWHFNTPHASHKGGVWERMIGVTRRIMSSLLDSGRLTDEILSTVFTEVEAIINGRPITKMSDQVDDPSPLTPSHLLLLRGGPVAPPGKFSQGDMYRRRWRYVQHLADQFWTRWVKEYLPQLQRRSKWMEKQENFKVGDLILLVDEHTPRSLWPLGLITDVKVGRDGLVRTVTIKTQSTTLVRPVTKVVKLEGELE